MYSIREDATGSDSIGTSGAHVALPTASDGVRARFVLVTCSANVYLHPKNGTSSADATNATMTLLTTASGPLLLNVTGFTHIYFVAPTGTVVVRVTPLENC